MTIDEKEFLKKKQFKATSVQTVHLYGYIPTEEQFDNFYKEMKKNSLSPDNPDQ